MASTTPTADGQGYSYRALQKTPPEVRLFVLLPGAGSDPIRGKITHHILQDGLRFDALSYTWGDPTPTAAIIVDDDKQLGVAANLHAALHDLRRTAEELVIWIDAICINQADIPERNYQVRLMHSIYSKPQQVRSWLDQTVDPGHPSIRKLMSFASVNIENVHPTDAAKLVTIDDLMSGFWNPVADILGNQYWNRLWVQQELILPPKFTIHCRHGVEIPGDAIIAFDMIYARAGAFGYSANDVATVKAYEEAHAKTAFGFDAPSRDIYQLRKLHHGKERDLKGSKGSHGFAGWGTLLGNLLQYGQMKATEPQDGLYGLLGLCLNVGEGDIAVDYRNSLVEVYAQVARFCIEEHDNINFLIHCRLAPDSGGSGGAPPPQVVDEVFPSWLPNWPRMSETVRGAVFMDESPRAGGRLCISTTRLSNDGRILSVRGIRISVIDAATDGPFRDTEPLASALNRLRVIAQADNLAEDEASDESDTERIKVKKGVLARLESVARANTEISLREAAKTAGSLGYQSDDEKWAVRGIIGGLIGRRAARLRSGHGWGRLVDADVRSGVDELWVLFGCAYPVILRPANSAKNYQVVSPMHVPGLMGGEAVKKLDNMEAEEHTIGSSTYPILTIQLV
jgi:hypothetical protein